MIKPEQLRPYLTKTSRDIEAMVDASGLQDEVEKGVGLLLKALESSFPVLVCGNGGSASDALHISGELVGRFFIDRPAMNVICLNTNMTVITAWANDVNYDSVFSRQVEAHGLAGGVLWGLSTSGNSTNVVRAFDVAKQLGMSTIAFTGRKGGELAKISDCVISVPGDDAPSAQNLHVILYHYMCAQVEARITFKAS